MNYIVNSVEQFREDAIKHTRIGAIKALDSVNTMLVEGNWDVDTLAPYPQGKIEQDVYHKTLGTFILSRKLLKLKDAPAQEMQNFILKFISDAENYTQRQYDIFVKELQVKIVDFSTIVFYGNHLESFFEVETSKGKTIYWKNEMKSFLSKNGDYVSNLITKKQKNK